MRIRDDQGWHTKSKRVLWSSEIDFDAWRDDYREDYLDATDDEIDEMINDQNYDDLVYEREILNINLPEPIIVIADLGLWNGRRTGYREIPGNIAKCLDVYGSSSYESTWYLDDRNDLVCDDMHHDGTNHYLYRTWKKTATQQQRANLISKIVTGETITRRDITRLTERLGDAICAAHGWDAVKYGMGKSKMVKKNAPAQNPETEKEIRMA